MEDIIFLGTGDSMGVPRVYCDCAVCHEARVTGVNRRVRSSILLRTEHGELLIDCGPDWVAQMEAIEQRFIKTVLITHPHFDHIAGLPEWADACRWLTQQGELLAPPDVLKTIVAQFPWIKNHMQLVEVTEDGFTWNGWNFTSHLMCHGKNGTSYAYRIEKNGLHVAYCPDAIDLSLQQKQFLKNTDILILGTNFYQEDAPFATRSVYDMVEAMELLTELSPRRQVYFTHMGHGVDLTAAYPLTPNITLARAGMSIDLSEIE